MRVDEVERAADRREHAEREHVDLEQAQCVEVVLVPLDDAALGHRGVLHRHQAREQAARDDEAAGVLRQVPRKADQRVDELHQLLHRQAVGIEAGLARCARAIARRPSHHARFFDSAVHLRGVEAERLAHVAHRALRAVGDDGRGQRRAVAAVLAVEVLDHLLAALVLEIHVDVRRLVALLGDEALEQHRHARRIDLGDAQCVADRRVGRRAAALAEDAAAARERDDVVHGEKVGLVGEVGDQREFVVDLRAHVRGHAGGKAPREACVDQPPQVGRRRLAGGHDLLGILVAQLVEREACSASATRSVSSSRSRG